MKILIADDDVVSRRLLQSYLQKWGHEVTVAENGAEAWRLFEAGHFPLVVTDWEMPEMDGPELIGKIRSSPKLGYVYTILLTARTQKEDLVEGMEAGADDFVSKPFDRDELRVRLRAGERIVNLEQHLEQQNRTLREAQAALVQGEKLAQLSQLTAALVPELTAPLTAISENLASLRRDALAIPGASPDLAHVLDESQQRLRRISDLVDKLGKAIIPDGP